LDFDFTSINFDEIANKIIEQKLFRKYDVEKLLISILYERFDIYVSLYDFFTDLSKISSLCETIHKFKIKDDLLNGTHIPCRKSIVDIDLMTGTEFEEFLCIFFTNQGYKCQTTKASGDQGIDLIAVKDDVKLAIQAKCYTGSVGNHAVMEAVAGTKYYKANRTMVITNSTFTKSAIELAKANNVILWDRQTLIEKISQNP
ncbi:MAG: restriction endonuclease, partial [Clostridia bacterium]|nr:restriction endonuclease [Clostridia bacterium]